MTNKDKILKSALTLFIKEGFHGTSTSKIAEEAGVSNGTLFHHFKTKEILINTLFVNIKEGFKEYLMKHMGTSNTTKGRIKECWYTCIEWSIKNKESTIFFKMFSSSPYIDTISKEEASRHIEFIVDIITEAIEDETVMNIDPKLILEYFTGSIHNYFNYYNENPSKLDDTIETAFNMLWRSIANI